LKKDRNPHGIPLLDMAVPEAVETATFAMGCFWGAEAAFGIADGVLRTRAGYAGGSTMDPTYHDLGDHTESVQVDFDPSNISFGNLLDIFLAHIDPYYMPMTDRYISILFYHDDGQKNDIDRRIGEIESEIGTGVAVKVLPYDGFYPAEEYHQKYYLKSVSDLAKEYYDIFGVPEKLSGSTAAARVNGYVSGMGDSTQLEREIDLLGLSDAGKKRLRQITALYRR